MAENLNSDQVEDLRSAFKKYAQPFSDNDEDEDESKSAENSSNDEDEDDGDNDDDDDDYDAVHNGHERPEKGYLDRERFGRAVGDVDFAGEDGEGCPDIEDEDQDAMFDECDWNGDGRVRWDAFVEIAGGRFGVEDHEREILRQWKRHDDGSGSVSRRDFISILQALGEDIGHGGSDMGEKTGSTDSADSGTDRIDFSDFSVMYGLSERAVKSFETKEQQKKKEEHAATKAERRKGKLEGQVEAAMQHFVPLAVEKAAALAEHDECSLCLETLRMSTAVTAAAAAVAAGEEEEKEKKPEKPDGKTEENQPEQKQPSSAKEGEKNPACESSTAVQYVMASQGPVVTFPGKCSHLFHLQCVTDVVKHQLSQKAASISCPVCRALFDWKGAAPPAASATTSTNKR